METVRSAVAALRSASDDLRKSEDVFFPTMFGLEKEILRSLQYNEPVRLKDVGFLVLALAQSLDAKTKGESNG